MKRSGLLFLLFPLLLASCSTKPGEDLNRQKNGMGLFQYGEVLGKAFSSSDAYEDYCIEDDGTGIVKALQSGENVFIIQTAKDCSHCNKLEPRFCEFLSAYPVKTFLLQAESLSSASNVTKAFETIKEAYPVLTFRNEFPRATTITSNITETSFLFSGYTSSLNDMCTLLLNQFHTENIAYFEKEESFLNYLKENSSPGYVYNDLSTFIKNDKEDVLKKSKTLAILSSSTIEEGYYTYEDGLKSVTKEEALKVL